MKSQIFSHTLHGLHQYLKASIVQPGPINIDNVRPLPGKNGFVESDGLIYQKSRGGYQLYDRGGVFDEVEGRVVGDHYATSHYILMCAALYLVDQDEQYLEDIKEAEGFCLQQLSGYPRVPWGMHLDFNNYAIAWAYELVGHTFSLSRKSRWKRALLWSPMNRHRVGNWWGQRSLYASLLKRMGTQQKIKAYLINSLYRNKFIGSLAKDGCFEDKVDSSRPVQYHAFSLALALAMEQYQPGSFTTEDLNKSVNFIKQYIGPDGDYNFFGRGHKQIFAYSPAIFCLLTTGARDDAELANIIFDYVKGFQLDGGDFPLVLSSNDKCSKVGWYDYHRHSVYNAFFAAWLALAQLQAKNGNFSINKIKSVGKKPSSRVVVAEDVASYAQRTLHYYSFLSDGYSHYGSECGLAFHKIYFNELGTLVSCPGGPKDEVLGFGSINQFPFESVNYFSPLVEVAGEFFGPGKIQTKGKRNKGGVEFTVIVKGIKIIRKVTYSNNAIFIEDILENQTKDECIPVRLLNLPLNQYNKVVELNADCLKIRPSEGGKKLVQIDIDASVPINIQKAEQYPWVDGPVQIFSAPACLTDRLSISIKIYETNDESSLF